MIVNQHIKLKFSTLKDYYHVIFLILNASSQSKDTALISVLQGHFKGQLNFASVKLKCLFVTDLCKIKTINYDRLAFKCDTNTKKENSYRCMQRFMKDFNFL